MLRCHTCLGIAMWRICSNYDRPENAPTQDRNLQSDMHTLHKKFHVSNAVMIIENYSVSFIYIVAS